MEADHSVEIGFFIAIAAAYLAIIIVIVQQCRGERKEKTRIRRVP